MRIHIYKPWLFVFVACLVLSVSHAEEKSGNGPENTGPTNLQTVERLVVRGHDRTDPHWVESFLGIKFPAELNDADVENVRLKLMTTGVFYRVKVSIGKSKKSKDKVLLVDLREKWSTIPVVRGTFGGGTPLKVIGMYDTHVFGSLWTIGGETWQFANEPPGWVVWARAPRWGQGKHEVSAELWRRIRLRTIYDKEDEIIGKIRSTGSMFRGLYMQPTSFIPTLSEDSTWQIGMDAKILRQEPNSFRPEADYTGNGRLRVRLSREISTQLTLLPRVVFDNITAGHLQMNGTRLILMAGPLVDEGAVNVKLETELFWYKMFPKDVNVATHYHLFHTNSDTLQAQTFLGGFESIRGIPDGAVYGNVGGYFNFELRKVMERFKYCVVQGVTFLDTGSAFEKWDGIETHARTSAGFGLRFAVPQIYRMVFRIDYAWDVNRPEASGISMGLNQLFQAYRPL